MSCLPLPWTCSITYSPHRSITPSSASSRPIPNRLSSFVTNLDIWPSTNSRRTSSIRLSPSATARSVPPSSPPTHRSPTGATYSSIRPSPRRSPTASSRTPRSLSGYLHPPQPEAFHHHHHQHTVLRLGQHTLQYDHRHGDRRPPRRELRDLLVRGRQPP